MRTKGRVTSWNDKKGFGFITPLDGGKRVFLHIKAFANRSRRPEINQVVTYALFRDKQGRPCAAKATLAGDRLTQQPEQSSRKSGSLSVIIAALFFVFVGVLALTSQIPLLIPVIYLAASLVTFLAYAVDKSAAKRGAWRTPESTLHLLALAGGWPGALLAQQKLRHKSRKQPFRMVFWITVFMNCGAFGWLLTADGAGALRSLISM